MEIVINEATCAASGKPAGKCKCSKHEVAPPFVQASKQAALRSVSAAKDPAIRGKLVALDASGPALQALAAARKRNGGEAERLHEEAAAIHDEAEREAEKMLEMPLAKKHRRAGMAHRSAASLHALSKPKTVNRSDPMADYLPLPEATDFPSSADLRTLIANYQEPEANDDFLAIPCSEDLLTMNDRGERVGNRGIGDEEHEERDLLIPAAIDWKAGVIR